MNIVSSVLALAIACLMFQLALSAPFSQVKDQLEDKDAKMTATDKLLNTLQHLLERKAMKMALKQVLATKQGKSTNWVYPPLNKVKSEGSEEERPDESPMQKAARKHFKISEPGTGPVLNHPLDISDTGLDSRIVETLINELMSSAK